MTPQAWQQSGCTGTTGGGTDYIALRRSLDGIASEHPGTLAGLRTIFDYVDEGAFWQAATAACRPGPRPRWLRAVTA